MFASFVDMSSGGRNLKSKCSQNRNCASAGTQIFKSFQDTEFMYVKSALA